MFVWDRMDVPQCFWENVLLMDETKVELFSTNTQRYLWGEKNIAHQHHNLILTVKHGGGYIMALGYFVA